jgi:hypothetical protein
MSEQDKVRMARRLFEVSAYQRAANRRLLSIVEELLDMKPRARKQATPALPNLDPLWAEEIPIATIRRPVAKARSGARRKN